MMVLKQRSKFDYVSFVRVSSEALKIATIKKLEKGRLIARDMGRFISSDNRPDVFVGCLESFKNGAPNQKMGKESWAGHQAWVPGF